MSACGRSRPASACRARDDRFLYVASSRRDQEVFGYLTDSDSPVYWEDYVELVIAPETMVDYYEFTVNARGTPMTPSTILTPSTGCVL